MPPMGMKQRAKQRRKKIVAHVARSHEDAERWDLEFWQRQTPQDRLSALVAIRKDVEKPKRRRSGIDIDSLIRTKRGIDNPRHQEDVRVRRQVKRLRQRKRT